MYIDNTMNSITQLETLDEPTNQVPIGIASVLTIRGSSAELIKIQMTDCFFDNCYCNATIPPDETRNINIGIGGAVSICGRNIHVNQTYCRYMNCYSNLFGPAVIPGSVKQVELSGGFYIGLIGGGKGEDKFRTKKTITEYIREEGDKSEDIWPLVNPLL